MLPRRLRQKLAATKKEKEMFQCQKFREAFCGSCVMTGERLVLEDGILTLKEKFEGSLDIRHGRRRGRADGVRRLARGDRRRDELHWGCRPQTHRF